MKIVRIFTDVPIEQCHLWTVRYDGENVDEFDRLFDLWTNEVYLSAFFKENINDLQAGFWKSTSVKEAVFKALEEADNFEDMIIDIEHGYPWNGKTSIKQIFQPLDNREYHGKVYQKQKAKPQSKKPFLRLYAIRLADDSFIVTGGAIKLTEKMNGSEHLERELAKMELVKNHLKENNILYFEDLTTI